MTATVRTTEGTLAARLDAAVRLVAGVLDELEPELLHSSDAGQLLDRFVTLGKRCDAGRTLVAARATAGDEWRQKGVHTPEEWLARKTGTTKEAAKRTIAASGALPSLSRTTDALKKCASGASPQVITTEEPAPSVEPRRRAPRRPRRRTRRPGEPIIMMDATGASSTTNR